MKWSKVGDAEDVEDDGVSFTGISCISATQDDFFFKTASVDKSLPEILNGQTRPRLSSQYGMLQISAGATQIAHHVSSMKYLINVENSNP